MLLRYIVAVQSHIDTSDVRDAGAHRHFKDDLAVLPLIPITSRSDLFLWPEDCCGHATLRKLSNLIKQIKKREGVEKE